MPNPKISVVTVCYNAADTIEETILSVLNQTYDNVEYIIIDGGSTDGTIDIIKKYADHLAYWVSEPDKGIYDAMNKGIDAATGDYINFMNAGDLFPTSSVISDCFSNAELNSVIIYGDWIEVFGNATMVKKASPLSHLNSGMVCPHQSLFVSTDYHKKRPFNLKYKIAADYDLVYHAYKTEQSFRYSKVVISQYDMTPKNSTSLKNYKTLIREHLTIQGYSDAYIKLIAPLKLLEYRIRELCKKLLPSKVVVALKQYLNS